MDWYYFLLEQRMDFMLRFLSPAIYPTSSSNIHWILGHFQTKLRWWTCDFFENSLFLFLHFYFL